MAMELACVCSQCSSKRNFGGLAAFLAIVSVVAVLFTGCEELIENIAAPPLPPEAEPLMVLELDNYVTAPEKDAAPNTDAIDSSHYTGTVVWKTESGEGHTGNFAAGSIYKAELVLSIKNGYTFAGLPANSFTYSGAAVTHEIGQRGQPYGYHNLSENRKRCRLNGS